MKSKFILFVLAGCMALSYLHESSASALEEGMSAFSSKKYEEALKILTPLAERNNSRARFFVNRMLDMREAISTDAKSGENKVRRDHGVMNWIASSAKNGDPVSQVTLGYLIQKKDRRRAAIWFKAAADSGNKQGLIELGKTVGFFLAKEIEAPEWIDFLRYLDPNSADSGAAAKEVMSQMIRYRQRSGLRLGLAATIGVRMGYHDPASTDEWGKLYMSEISVPGVGYYTINGKKIRPEELAKSLLNSSNPTIRRLATYKYNGHVRIRERREQADRDTQANFAILMAVVVGVVALAALAPDHSQRSDSEIDWSKKQLKRRQYEMDHATDGAMIQLFLQ